MRKQNWKWRKTKAIIKDAKTKDSGFIENRKGARTIMDTVLEDADRANRQRHNPFRGVRFTYLSQSHVRQDRISEAREGQGMARRTDNRPDGQS
jgi:hypothetical protein